MQDVFRRNGLVADAAFGEGDIFRDPSVEVMRDHYHIERLLQRVHCVRPGRSGRGRNHIRLSANLNDVGRVAATSALGMKGVNSSSLKRRNRTFDEATLV